MNITAETLGLFLILIPGFVSSLILDALVVRKPRSNLSQIIEALVFSFFIYVIVSVSVSSALISIQIYKSGDITTYEPIINTSAIVVTAILSLVTPLIISISITNDLHMKFLRWLSVTIKTARHNTWLDVFIDNKERYVFVHLRDERRLFGWPLYYSNTPEEGLLYLYDAAWVSDEGEYDDVGGDGIFLVDKSMIESIVFSKLTKDTAKEIAAEGS